MDTNTTTTNKDDTFTRFPQNVMNNLLVTDISMRDYKIINLVARLTYGCHKTWAKLKQADLVAIGISPTHAGDVMRGLLATNLVLQNEKTKQYRINEVQLETNSKTYPKRVDRLTRVIGVQLKKDSYQYGNTDIPEQVTKKLPKEEPNTSQSGSTELLPNKEESGSDDGQISHPKDIVKDKITNSDKDTDIAGINPSKKEEKTYIDPYQFEPNSGSEYQAFEAWQRVEPNNREAFGSYLSASKRGLPEALFGQFASEVLQDHTIKNRGAVYMSKISDYFTRHKVTKTTEYTCSLFASCN